MIFAKIPVTVLKFSSKKQDYRLYPQGFGIYENLWKYR